MPTELLIGLGLAGAVPVAVGLTALVVLMTRRPQEVANVLPSKAARRRVRRPRHAAASAPPSAPTPIRSGRREAGVSTRLRGVGTPACIGLPRRS